MTVPQLADGGTLLPKMFGLTKKINKMKKTIEIIRKKFPVSVEILDTECNIMKGNRDRLLLKKEHCNDYCLIEVHNGTDDEGFTLFKSDCNDFKDLEIDFMKGFSFVPKNVSETFIIINSLV